MDSALQAVRDTPVPQFLIWVGVALVVLSIIRKFGTYIEVPPEGQTTARVLGLALLLGGVGLNMWTGLDEPRPNEPIAVTPAVAEQPSLVAPRPTRPAASAPSQAPVEVVTIDYPWFIIMGSFSNYDNAAREARRFRAAGLDAKLVRSSDYERLTPDHFVIVLGANSRDEANQMLPQARALVPEAYLKAPR